MKKLVAGICIVAALFVIAVYVFIPSTLIVSNIIFCKSKMPRVFRTISSTSKWNEWWIDKNSTGNNSFNYNGYDYVPGKSFFNGIIININSGKESIKTELVASGISNDSCLINWKFNIHTSVNPFKRISEYYEAVNLKKNNDDILNHFKKFVENDSKVYGIPIGLSTIEYGYLITIKEMFNHTPSTNEIYSKINLLKQFSNAHNLKQTYFPMMNVTLESDTAYRLMVGLPVDKKTELTGNIKSVAMVHGNYLITEVKGGYGTINNAINQLQFYVDDYDKTPMAIPFQYIITDRMNEVDTSKWVTKIYQPVN